MLYKNVVDEKTHALLKNLMKENILKDFFLVGGTSIALQIGHRKSVDLDLFTQKEIDTVKLKEYLQKNYSFKVHYEEKNTLKGFIDDILIDCIKYDYKQIDKIKIEDNIRLLSLKDIIPMKLVAIMQDGSRIKDFYDIVCLNNFFSLNEMLDFFHKKYDYENDLSIIKALTYFEDLNDNEPLLLFNNNITKTDIEKHLINMTKTPNLKLPFSYNINPTK